MTIKSHSTDFFACQADANVIIHNFLINMNKTVMRHYPLFLFHPLAFLYEYITIMKILPTHA